jgi:hypothetical protein
MASRSLKPALLLVACCAASGGCGAAHSAMDPQEKQRALGVWRKRWAEFVRWLNETG